MLIDTFSTPAWQIKVFDRIADLDETLWDTTMAHDHPFRSHRFMMMLEASYPERAYRYLVARAHGAERVAGLLFATQQHLDLLSEAPSWAVRCTEVVRRLLPLAGMLRIAMLGCFETAGRHWWVDPEHDETELFAVLESCARHALPKARVHVVRDLENDAPISRDLHRLLLGLGFRACNNYPLALIRLEGRDWSAHYTRLKANSRKILKKALSAYDASGYRVIHHEGTVPDLAQLYALYVNTHQQATEYHREVLPMALFQRLQGSGLAVFSVLHAPGGQAVAFVLSGVSDKVINPFLFGRDYDVELPVNAYYVLHIDLMRHYISPDTHMVDLGITNYFVKQNLGCELSDNRFYLKLSNPVLHRILGHHVAKMFDIRQPTQRRVFRAGRADGQGSSA